MVTKSPAFEICEAPSSDRPLRIHQYHPIHGLQVVCLNRATYDRVVKAGERIFAPNRP